MQVIHGPDGFAKGVHALLAGRCGARFFVQVQSRSVGVVFGQVDDELHCCVQPLSSFLVTGSGPFFGPVFHHKHEAQSPHLREGRNLFVSQLGLFCFRQDQDGATGVQRFRLEGDFVSQRLDVRIQLGAHFVQAQLEQLHETGLLGFVLEGFQLGQGLTSGHVQRFTVAQQHGQVFSGFNGAACADQSGQKTVAELPLGDFVATGAHFVEQGIQLFELIVAQCALRHVGGGRIFYGGVRCLFLHRERLL